MTKPVFSSREQLDTTLKLARAGGLWWAHSLTADEISGLVGMTADEIKEVCDRAVERDIADGCDESNWREDPRPAYTTGTGRTRWAVGRDGSATVIIRRPAGEVIDARYIPGDPWISLVIMGEDSLHLRHVDALIETLRALDPKAEAKVWEELGRRPAIFAHLVEEDIEWRRAGLPNHALPRWRSSRETGGLCAAAR